MAITRMLRVLGVFLLVLVAGIPVLARARGGDTYSQLPLSGPNFQAYSTSMHLLGRCYLLAPLTATLTEAYASLEVTCPGREFIYLEMGWRGGGAFPPHKTHRQGVSADFLTPMKVRGSGKPVNLPISPLNRWGYDIRLDTQGCYHDFVLDSEALIKHLDALEQAARRRGWRIKQVILDPPLFALLQRHSVYLSIRHIPFMKGPAWFPHDGHYHVDFTRQ